MSAKTVVILQSNYIPWKGYFDLVNSADEFIFYDDVQFTTGDWRNRNKIKTPEGTKWLTIPVGNDISRKICEVQLKGQEWKQKHRRTITHYYKSAAFFKEYETVLDALYENESTSLSEYNQKTIQYISGLLGIQTKFSDSRTYQATGGKTERLVSILTKAKASRFLCGPAVKAYIEETKLKEAGIELVYFNYENYPEYRQLYGSFVHQVSILDLIFNEGKNATKYMKTFRTV